MFIPKSAPSFRVDTMKYERSLIQTDNYQPPVGGASVGAGTGLQVEFGSSLGDAAPHLEAAPAHPNVYPATAARLEASHQDSA